VQSAVATSILLTAPLVRGHIVVDMWCSSAASSIRTR